MIDVIAKPTMGTWRGMLNGNIGTFKFVYVDVLEDRGSEKYQSHRAGSRSGPESLEELLKQNSLGVCLSNNSPGVVLVLKEHYWLPSPLVIQQALLSIVTPRQRWRKY